ncbi:MAG: DUF2975 domain-containing protein [Oscillospiraceae bacterium]|nr:DUF2975 domain-containing protein [Oscillospiraceae bacterium]
MNTLNTKIVKIKKMSKVLNAFLKIGAIVLIMVIILQIVLIAISSSLDLSSNAIIDVFGINIPLNGNINNFRAIMLFTMSSAAVMAAVLFVASFIFKNISRDGLPFTKRNSNKIKIISLLLIAHEVLLPPLRLLILMVLIPEAEAAVSMNLGIIVAAAVFFCIALIFEYGAELQQQSDETL